MARRKRTRGGKRPRAGRPPLDTVKIQTSIGRDDYAKLVRIAKKAGLVHRKGGKPFLGSAISIVLSGVKTEEPDYLKTAKEIANPRKG